MIFEDKELSIKYLQQAANAGNVYTLARYYADSNREQAIKYYIMAIEKDEYDGDEALREFRDYLHKTRI